MTDLGKEITLFLLESPITMFSRHSILPIGILLASIASAAVPAGRPASEDDSDNSGAYPASNLIVLSHHCDGLGGIDAINVLVDGTGPHSITWNNWKMCGLRS